MEMGKRKDGVSVNARIGAALFAELERLCDETGQSKTVAVERAIRAYCAPPAVRDGDEEAAR